MKRYSSSKDTGAPCQRCMILRVFLGMVLFVVILGLAGGNELSYFKYKDNINSTFFVSTFYHLYTRLHFNKYIIEQIYICNIFKF